MARRIEFTVPGQPVGKGRARVTTHGGFARAYTPEKTAVYENLVKLSFQAINETPLDGAIEVSILAYYAIPKSFSRKKRDAALRGDIKPNVKPDLDNVIKSICDGLNRVAYNDDKQITFIAAAKYYGEPARVKIALKEVENDIHAREKG